MTQIIRPQASKYTFNLRSFHPESSFGWSGLAFGGDRRGFSLKPSEPRAITSRIRHFVKIDMKSMSILNEDTGSDESKAAWSNQAFSYDDPKLEPKSTLFALPSKQRKDSKTFSMKGKYSGSNHAMPLSPEMQKTLGFTYVPDIDVQYELFIELNAKESMLMIGARISGDGFPNTEAFITDEKGTAIFLGTHVRQGIAPTTLAANLTHPLFKNVLQIPINVHGHFKDHLFDVGNQYLTSLPNAKKHKISDWNQGFLNGNPNQGHCMGLEELKRFRECF